MRHLLALAFAVYAPSAWAVACPGFDYDLGDATGAAIAAGNSCGTVNDVGATCGAAAASEEVTFLWTAPADGDFEFDAQGSVFDTVIHIQNANNCREIVCNDDFYGLQSKVVLAATRGTEYIVNMDGYSAGNCGNFTLNSTSCSIDSDGDGICDQFDACFGDDATGDTDGDGLCDNVDMNLQSGPLAAGQPFEMGVNNAPPGAHIFFMASSRTGNVCHPQGFPCLDLGLPMVVVGDGYADANGQLRITINTPQRLPQTVYLQAWYVAVGGGGAITNRLTL